MASPASKLRTDREQRPALASLVGYQLRRVSTQSMAALEVLIADLDLRTIHYTVLSTVQAQPGVTQNQICRAVNIRPGNLVPIIGDLVRRGLVTRERDAKDKRVARVHIEPAGQAVVDELHRRVLEHERQFYARLSAGERAALMAMLGRLGAAEPATDG